MPTRSTEPLYRIKADLFKSLAHPTRIQVLEVLAADPEHRAAVGHLLEVTGAEASQLSQHLAVLKRAGVVASGRTGNHVQYQLTAPVVAELLTTARAFLLTRLTGAADQLDAAAELPPLPGASAQALLDAAARR
ncbi:ArsR/SmtB family transcription factor [Ruania zhangjianzhongii]|uniref:ArsR/SmtB family transcription factor n=1 Tax=Ruania zhangjianzhongii TaxID=2603206 RepID=UPI0011C7ADB7|nr:metalloregulator ArsR/SmtB family transcription factor [Ruania zhangjianzhongii]